MAQGNHVGLEDCASLESHAGLEGHARSIRSRSKIAQLEFDQSQSKLARRMIPTGTKMEVDQKLKGSTLTRRVEVDTTEVDQKLKGPKSTRRVEVDWELVYDGVC